MKNVFVYSYVIILIDEDNVKLFCYFMGFGVSGMLLKQVFFSQLIYFIFGLWEGCVFILIFWFISIEWVQLLDFLGEEFLVELIEIEIFIMERIVQGVIYDKIVSEINVS